MVAIISFQYNNILKYEIFLRIFSAAYTSRPRLNSPPIVASRQPVRVTSYCSPPSTSPNSYRPLRERCQLSGFIPESSQSTISTSAPMNTSVRVVRRLPPPTTTFAPSYASVRVVTRPPPPPPTTSAQFSASDPAVTRPPPPPTTSADVFRQVQRKETIEL